LTPETRPSVAVTATFSVEPLREALTYWMELFELPLPLRFSPGTGVAAALLAVDDTFAVPGSLGVLLVRAEDLGEAGADALLAALRDRAQRSPLLLIVAPDAAAGHDALLTRLRELLAARSDVTLVGPAELPVRAPEDVFEKATAVPYTEAFFVALATRIGRFLQSRVYAPFKVVAVDADDTLWSGACAEEGPTGVGLDAPRLALQRRLLAAREAGQLLVLVSKNDEADVSRTFAANPTMPLSLAHFAATRVGWGAKSESLRALSVALGLGLDTFVFLDDSPAQLAEVRSAAPEVAAFQVPHESSAIPAWLGQLWALDGGPTTEADTRRAEAYDVRREREEARQAAGTLRSFVESLDLRVRFARPRAEDLERLAQLTWRVNQMRLSDPRLAASDVAAAMAEGAEVWSVDVADRFGDEGTVGALLAQPEGETLLLTTFVLSCRALGRGVEHAMFAHLATRAAARGLRGVEVRFTPTARSGPALALLRDAGAPIPSADAGLFRHSFETTTLAALRYAPWENARGQAPSESPELTAPEPPQAAVRRARALERVATELATPEAIVAAVRAARAAPQRASYAAPRGALAQEIAAIWAEVLGVPAPGSADDFFALGGHSVAAVRVVSRLRARLGVEVDPAALLRSPTLAAFVASLEAPPSAAPTPELDTTRALAPSHQSARNSRATRSGLALGVVTCARPRELARAVESYLDAASETAWAEVVVTDDAGEARAEDITRALLAPLAARSGASIRHGGAAEKSAYAAELAVRAGVPEALVRFAFIRGSDAAGSCGANRNALLLDGAGGSLFSVDDDTIARFRRPSPRATQPSDDVDEPSSYAPFADDTWLDDAEDLDLVAALSSVLGRSTTELLGEGAAGGAQQRARLVIPGLSGDCGWGAPFGYWHAPMGYLALRGASRARFVASETEYRRAWTSRGVHRVVPKLTWARPSLTMSTTWGLDATSLLPPFLPVARGSDLLMGLTARSCVPDLGVLHLPWTIAHAPEPRRRFSPGEMPRAAAGVDLCRVACECIEAYEPDPAEASPAARLRALGRHLAELGGRGGPGFEAFVRARLALSNGRLREFLAAQQDGDGPCPAYWVNDVATFRALLDASEPSADYAVPLDLVLSAGGNTEALLRAAQIVRRFGELLQVWPEIFATAAAMREEGRRLSRAVEP
jgi:FkbH-like protein